MRPTVYILLVWESREPGGKIGVLGARLNVFIAKINSYLSWLIFSIFCKKIDLIDATLTKIINAIVIRIFTVNVTMDIAVRFFKHSNSTSPVMTLFAEKFISAARLIHGRRSSGMASDSRGDIKLSQLLSNIMPAVVSRLAGVGKTRLGIISLMLMRNTIRDLSSLQERRFARDMRA